MSKFSRALAYVLENEGVDSDHPQDSGGRTRFGITEKTARRHGYDVTKITQSQAAGIYRREYWSPAYDRIQDEPLAIKVFDFAVNAGPHAANVMLQEAANDLGQCLAVDGVIGAKTILAVNNLKPWAVIRTFAIRQSTFYQRIVEKNPAQAVFAKGWQARAARVPMTDGQSV